MTLYYDPPLDGRLASEYCRNNVTASLGTVRTSVDKETGEEIEYHTREIYPVPKEFDAGWEKDLIKNGFKWSPLKLYRRQFRRGPTGLNWQLALAMVHRQEFDKAAPQDVHLIITIRDPEGIRPVYNEFVQQINRLGWASSDWNIRSRARIK